MPPKLAKRQLVEPDYWTCPHGVRVRPESYLTYGPEVAEFNDKAGFTPDPQQELGLDLIHAIRPDGSPATFTFCVICARQNLKSGLFLQACLGWTFVYDDVPEIAWSAHELKTSLGALSDMQKILENSFLSKYLYPARANGVSPSFMTGHSGERIELNTGQKIWFQTRTKDGGRGLSKPKVILDEAFKLKPRTVGALLPILLAKHHPQLLYGSSAPAYEPDAMVLRDVMDRGRNHKSSDLSYIEWLAPREPCKDPDCLHPKDAAGRALDCALDREHLIRRANPTLTTGRITLRTIQALRQELPPVEFMRECLGWPEEQDEAEPLALDAQRWAGMANKAVPPPTKAVAFVYVEPDQSAATIALAGNGGAGRTLVLIQHRRGTAWVAKSLKKVAEECELLEVRRHPGSATGALKAELKVRVKAPGDLKAEAKPAVKATVPELGDACSSFQTGVAAGLFVHVDQAELNAAVGAARTKSTGNTEQWDFSGTTVPGGPVIAASNAAQRWAELDAETPKAPPPSPVAARPRASNRTSSPATAGF